RTFRQRAVTDFAASRSAQELHFADAERRKIVMQQETLELILLEEQVEPLHVFFGAESKRREGLGFTASEERGAMHAWQQANFAGDLANLVEGAAVRTPLGIQNIVAENLLAQALERSLGQRALFLFFFRNCFDDLVF